MEHLTTCHMTETELETYKYVWQRKDPYPTLRKFKTSLTGAFLIPLRLTCLVLLNCVCFPVGLFIIKLGVTQSHGKRRQIFQIFAWVWFRSMLFFLGYMIIPTYGQRPKLSQIPSSHIIIGNHCGYAEIVYMIAQFLPSIVAKRAISEMKFIGTITDAIKCIYVDRIQTGEKKVSVSQKIIDFLATKDGHHNTLGMFPEGTTTNGNTIVHFRTGAFVPGVPVVPIIFRFKSILFDPCCCSFSIKKHLLDSMATPFNYMSVEYLPVYYPSDEEKSSPELYSKNVHALMCEKSKIPPRDDMEYADKLKFEAGIGYKNSDVRKAEKRRASVAVEPEPEPEPEPEAEDKYGDVESNASSLQRPRAPRDTVPTTIMDKAMEKKNSGSNLSSSFLPLDHKLAQIVTREKVAKWNDPTRRRGSSLFVGTT